MVPLNSKGVLLLPRLLLLVKGRSPTHAVSLLSHCCQICLLAFVLEAHTTEEEALKAGRKAIAEGGSTADVAEVAGITAGWFAAKIGKSLEKAGYMVTMGASITYQS